MTIHRYQTKEFMRALTSNVEVAFKRFLGSRMRPIYDAQWGAQSSWGYRIRDTAYFMLTDGTPLVCGLDLVPRGRDLPRPLDPALLSEHEAWLELYESHMHDWPRLERSLGSLILKAETVQDWRDMFPEAVIQSTLEHPYLQTKDVNNVPTTMLRSRPDLLASATATNFNGWSKGMVDQYASISDAVDTYIGFKFLQ